MMIGKTYLILIIIGSIAFSNGATTGSSATTDAMEPSTIEQNSQSAAATTVMSNDAVTTMASVDATTNPQLEPTTVMAETTQEIMTTEPMMDTTTRIMMDPKTTKIMETTTEKMMTPTTEKMMDPTTGPMIPVTRMALTTTPPYSGSSGNTQTQESDFGRVGLIAFGLMFAISIILLVLLIVMVYRFKSQSGTYKTNEGSSPRHMMDGIHMTMPMDNGGLDNVHTIDLDKGEGEDRGAGVSTFAAVNEQEKQHGNGVKSSFGATDKSEFKMADSGSINNLLHTEESDKNDDSDKESDTENPSTFIGLKVEPSTGASVESLERLKETDNLMDDDEKDDDSSSSESEDDEDLPPPALSDSDNDDKNKDDSEV